jgi:chromosome segregation ATPase
MRQVGETSTAVQNLLEEIRIRETESDRIQVRVSEVRSQMDDMNEVRRREYDSGQALLGSVQTEVDEQRRGLSELQDRLLGVEGAIRDFPTRVRDAACEHEIAMGKKKQLTVEIQKKIESQIQELIAQQSRSPVVASLTAQLENHWSEHAKMTESVDGLERKLYGLQEAVERKKMIVVELKQHFRNIVGEGLRQQDEMYRSARSQNSEFAQKMAALKREVFIYESEQKQFERTLSELE